jgi:hypothetical protein
LESGIMDLAEPETDIVIGHIQTDTFCESCGYNLHTQAVRRDARLGILICRCPECGRWTAAGKSTAREAWLNRLGTAMLMSWVLLLLVAFGFCSLFLALANYGNMANGLIYHQSPPTPQNPYPAFHRVLRPPPAREREIAQERFQNIMMACLMGGLGLFTGALAAVAFWHLHGWRQLVALLPPLIGFAGAWLAVVDDDDLLSLHGWAMKWLSIGLLGECVAILAGLKVGRPVARAALQILLPPKGRQHLSFLWTTDGKTLRT